MGVRKSCAGEEIVGSQQPPSTRTPHPVPHPPHRYPAMVVADPCRRIDDWRELFTVKEKCGPRYCIFGQADQKITNFSANFVHPANPSILEKCFRKAIVAKESPLQRPPTKKMPKNGAKFTKNA